ncbi:CHAP domain-containing protein, partial [Staphylococcus pseudintermedius]
MTGIDLDELYDELQIAEFNDKAKTADGKPLALGNGKIID